MIFLSGTLEERNSKSLGLYLLFDTVIIVVLTTYMLADFVSLFYPFILPSEFDSSHFRASITRIILRRNQNQIDASTNLM